MADSVIGGREGRTGVFYADYSCFLEGRRLLGRLVSARGDREAVWNQGLWPNLRTEKQMLSGTGSCHRGKQHTAGSPTALAMEQKHPAKTERSNSSGQPLVHL